MNRSILLLSLLFLPLFTLGQEVSELSKETAVAEALEKNFGIVIARNELEIADANSSILNSRFLPIISATAGFNYSNEDQEVTFRNGEVNAVNGAETERYNAALNLNYTLFDGLGRWYDYKRFKEQYNLSELQVRQTIETTLLQLFTVYFEVARLRENVTVLEQTYSNTQDRLTRVQYQFDYGQVNKLEVLNAEVDLVTDSINLINGRQLLRNAKRDLTVVLNSELEREFTVDTAVAFLNPVRMEDYYEQAPENNVDLLIAQSNIQVSDYSYKAAKSVYLPTLNLNGSYGWNEGQFPVTSFATSSTSTGLSVGLSLNWNLFDGGTGITNVKTARILKENQEIFEKQLIVELSRNLANARGNYRNSLEIYRLQRKNVLTAQDNYERSAERYKLGQISSVELRLAQINLLNSQTNRNLAKYQAKLAELELLQLSGQLLNVEF
ncbi:TolC family protein [Gilvibacter sediminis]|uniref:TolC family protein n=1 Tax=Gilvibacter sediminis TaxID=379071 RepID=UPI00234FD56A|nr:TolC family protein [Gilvibacter sediminis]MDC7997449.1 TolC family protein [Gilvibacter sediminis]